MSSIHKHYDKNEIRVTVEAPLAMFSHPELKAEAYSYSMIPVSAARGILDCCYWHPYFTWRIDSITVCNEITRLNVKTLNVADRISAEAVKKCMKLGVDLPAYYAEGSNSQLLNNSFLKNVKYGIAAHVELRPGYGNEYIQKALEITEKRLKHGKCFKQPTCGRKELPAVVKLWDGSPLPVHPSLCGVKDMGVMFHDFDYTQDVEHEGKPEFRHVELHDGVYSVERS